MYVKIYIRIKKKRPKKDRKLLINWVLFSLKMRKYASFAEMNIILTTIPKVQLLSFVTLIYWKILLLLKHFFPYTVFPLIYAPGAY